MSKYIPARRCSAGYFLRYKMSIGTNEQGWICQAVFLHHWKYIWCHQLKKPQRDSVRQTWGEQEACSSHNFPTSLVLRIRSSMKHRKPKQPFHGSCTPGGLEEFGASPELRKEQTDVWPMRTQHEFFQLGAQGNQRANSAKEVKR